MWISWRTWKRGIVPQDVARMLPIVILNVLENQLRQVCYFLFVTNIYHGFFQVQPPEKKSCIVFQKTRCIVQPLSAMKDLGQLMHGVLG